MRILIIDAHCHFWEEDLISTEFRTVLNNIGQLLDFDPSLLFDASAERLIKEMDEAGIDKTVLLALDGDFVFSSKLNYKEYNNKLAEYLENYPDRFIGFAGIDPRRGKEAIIELERCVSELGCKGVKLWPLTGFYPDDLSYYPFYKRVEELGATVLIHTGAGPPGTYLKYCQPVYVDKIAVDFPKINFIMAHIGDPWTNEAIAVAMKNSNVYIDISGWEPHLKKAPFAFFQTLIEAKMTCGVDKILFGTDWPLFNSFLNLKEYVDGIKNMKLPPPMKMMGFNEFTEEEKNKILGENAKNLLGL
ncbi:MAG: amidohydrolase [Promethearchaeota archaeon]|nr:MAG: amidohydrolase [Candidatus Lokiarchaeota archaeon]